MICGTNILYNIIWEIASPTKYYIYINRVNIIELETDDITIHKLLYECDYNNIFMYIYYIIVLLIYL